MITRGRVLKAGEAAELVPLELPTRESPRGHVVRHEVVAAQERAAQIVAEAEQRAAQLLEAARRDSANVRLRAETEARAEAAAGLAAKALALAELERRADERALDRSVGLATILAERLLGHALELEPALVAQLARRALAEASGARRITIVAHPDDVKVLEASLATLSVGDVTRIHGDAGRPRGSLRIETEIGALDADLAPQLSRLALKLRESLG